MARSKSNPNMIRTNAMKAGEVYGMGDIGKKAEGKRPVRFMGLFMNGEAVKDFPKMKELTTAHTLRVVRLDTESPEEVTLHLNSKEPIFCLNPEKKGTRQTFTTWRGKVAPVEEINPMRAIIDGIINGPRLLTYAPAKVSRKTRRNARKAVAA